MRAKDFFTVLTWSLFLGFGCGPLLALQEWTVPHLPAEGANFTAAIVVENQLNQERYLLIQAYDSLDRYAGSFPLTVPPLGRLNLDPLQWFDHRDIAYFSAHGDVLKEGGTGLDSLNGITLGVVFQFKDLPESATFIESVTRPSKVWRVQPGNWNEVFDGLVMVNLDGCLSPRIQVFHYDAGGTVLKMVEPIFNRREQQKLILNLGSTFDYVPGSYLEIRSESFLAVLALRGSLSDRQGSPYLIGNLATPKADLVEERWALQANRSKWEQMGIDSYSLNYRNQCFCGPEVTRPVNLQVRANWIRSFVYDDDGSAVDETFYQVFLDIPRLFDLIQRAVDDQAYFLKVSYDPAFGFPTHIFIDWDVCAADEETTIAIDDFLPLRN